MKRAGEVWWRQPGAGSGSARGGAQGRSPPARDRWTHSYQRSLLWGAWERVRLCTALRLRMKPPALLNSSFPSKAAQRLVPLHGRPIPPPASEFWVVKQHYLWPRKIRPVECGLPDCRRDRRKRMAMVPRARRRLPSGNEGADRGRRLALASRGA